MIIAVTGTPGTGKTTAVEQLETDLKRVHVNEVIETEELAIAHDGDRDSRIVDPATLRERFGDLTDAVVESHLAHYLPADKVVVLRCHPEVLTQRLQDRGESAASIQENAESEALDVILTAAVDRHGEDSVYEIETTNKSPRDVAAAIEAVIQNNRPPQSGVVSYLDYLTDYDT